MVDMSQYKDFFDEMMKSREEELHEDLKPHVSSSSTFGRVLKHPLVMQVPLLDNGAANRLYAEKQKAIEAASNEGDWHSYVWLHERPYRTDALIDALVGRDENTGEVMQLIGLDADIRAVAADVWQDSENIHQHITDWTQMISGWEPGDPLIFGGEDDIAKFNQMPDKFDVHRGDCVDGRWSWTLDKKVALFFAKRWGEHHDLLSGWVEKKDVFGFLTGRSESEVMVHYHNVKDVKVNDY